MYVFSLDTFPTLIFPSSPSQTPVKPWFKPLAYALTLLRKEGHPCVFYGDLYGIRANVKRPMTPACKGKLPILTQARKHFAYGEQQDYFDAPHCIGMPLAIYDHIAGCDRLTIQDSSGTETPAIAVSPAS